MLREGRVAAGLRSERQREFKNGIEKPMSASGRLRRLSGLARGRPERRGPFR
jgi:hypothetical protein